MAKTIEDIYTEYNIPPSLREHMYRVTAVATIICDNFTITIDRKSIIQTCLLHDMGNILKMKMDVFPEFFEPEGIEYWEGVKKDFKQKYNTTDPHIATLAIAVEVEASLRTLEILHTHGFLNALEVLNSNEFEKKICLYSDMRVGPRRVATLGARLEDFKSRYENLPDALTAEEYQKRISALSKIEQQVFERSDIIPEYITEEKVHNIVLQLKSTNIN